jgi:cytochrome c-type biogenesis protein CcmH
MNVDSRRVAFRPLSLRERSWGEGPRSSGVRSGFGPSPRPSPVGRGSQRRCAAVLAMLLALLFPSFVSFAQPASDPTPLQFADTVEERRFQMLVSELRCVMCQNQSLADSNAQIAVDLRREVLALIRDGRSDAEIRQFLVERYGEFVLYRPRVGASTWLLWFGPAVVLIGGALLVAGIVRRRAASPPPADDEQEW